MTDGARCWPVVEKNNITVVSINYFWRNSNRCENRFQNKKGKKKCPRAHRARPCRHARVHAPPFSPGGGSLGRRCWLIGTGVEDKQQMVPLGKDGTQCGKCSLPGHDESRWRGGGTRGREPSKVSEIRIKKRSASLPSAYRRRRMACFSACREILGQISERILEALRFSSVPGRHE